jgi:hypothetical protein
LNYWVRLQLSKLYLKGDLLPWEPGIAIPSLWAHPFELYTLWAYCYLASSSLFAWFCFYLVRLCTRIQMKNYVADSRRPLVETIRKSKTTIPTFTMG